MLYILSLFVISANAAFNHEIHSKYVTLPHKDFIEYFNSLNLTWKAGHFDEDKGSYHYCTYIDRNTTYPTVKHDVSLLNLPDSFDARVQWPQCTSISNIYDQQWCGSCWTFGTATTASDRNCIHANININLSEQDLSCCPDCFSLNACNGGAPERAFQFWIDSGLVSYDCLPYDPTPMNTNTACSKTCVNGNDYNSDKNYGGRVYAVSSDEDQIKAELYNNGPIEASIRVYEDLMDYTQGVYVHTYGKERGLHSVRVIGYGEEGGKKYWLIANSWGTTKGDNGFYKLQSYQTDIGLEDSLLTAMPKGQ